MSQSKVAFIALGANLGKPEATFSRALAELARRGVVVEAMSGLWRSPAWPLGGGAPDYVNAIAKVRTRQSPEHLLAILMEVEAGEGRVRTLRNAPRTLDLDIVDMDGVVQSRAELILPHPRLQDRAFVLLPLLEVAPDWRHPVSGLGIWEMMGRLGSADVLAAHRLPTPVLAPASGIA